MLICHFCVQRERPCYIIDVTGCDMDCLCKKNVVFIWLIPILILRVEDIFQINNRNMQEQETNGWEDGNSNRSEHRYFLIINLL